MDIDDLDPSQIDSVHLTSDRVRAFEKTQKKFEQEKIGKDPQTIQNIEHEIADAKKIHELLYQYYKSLFYRNYHVKQKSHIV